MEKVIKHIHFDELNNCALLDLFDALDLEELISVANINSRFRDLVTKYYAIQKFGLHKKTLRIGFSKVQYSNNRKKLEYSEFSINIYDMATAIRYLRNFGHLVQHIIVYNTDYKQHRSWNQNIIEYVTEYCSESLKDLELWFYGTFNNTWKKPFTKLTKIEFHGKCHWIESTNNIKCGSEMFPSLNEILIDNIESEKSLCLAFNFPHLKNVHLGNINSNSDRYKTFFEMNSQIKSLKIDYVNSLPFLHSFSETLPNLEHLDITIGKDVLHEFELGDIHIRNVKNCSVDLKNQHSNHIPFVFDNAEEITIHRFLSSETQIVNFMTKHHNVQVLNLKSGGFNLEQWMLIIENVPNLVKIQKWWDITTENDSIFGLMAAETHLQSVILFSELNEHCNTFWRRLVNSQWHVVCERDSSYSTITFTRDQNNNRIESN